MHRALSANASFYAWIQKGVQPELVRMVEFADRRWWWLFLFAAALIQLTFSLDFQALLVNACWSLVTVATLQCIKTSFGNLHRGIRNALRATKLFQEIVLIVAEQLFFRPANWNSLPVPVLANEDPARPLRLRN